MPTVVTSVAEGDNCLPTNAKPRLFFGPCCSQTLLVLFCHWALAKSVADPVLYHSHHVPVSGSHITLFTLGLNGKKNPYGFQEVPYVFIQQDWWRWCALGLPCHPHFISWFREGWVPPQRVGLPGKKIASVLLCYYFPRFLPSSFSFQVPCTFLEPG